MNSMRSCIASSYYGCSFVYAKHEHSFQILVTDNCCIIVFKHDDVSFTQDVVRLYILTGMETNSETDTVREQDRSGLTM